MRKNIILISFGIIVLGFLFWLGRNSVIRASDPESEIISRNGLHWHPELTIYVQGIRQEIPANVGLGVRHQPIHTHDDSGVIHLEFTGVVRKKDVALGQFFKNWGKSFDDFGKTAKMTVNGAESSEFMNYHMKDKDMIEIRFGF